MLNLSKISIKKKSIICEHKLQDPFFLEGGQNREKGPKFTQLFTHLRHLIGHIGEKKIGVSWALDQSKIWNLCCLESNKLQVFCRVYVAG